MALTSAFDGGACTVKVRPYTFDTPTFGVPLWSGLLTKGQSSPDFSGAVGDILTVDVDATGVVTLSADYDGNFIYALDVVPSYALIGRPIHALDISAAMAGDIGEVSNLSDISADVRGTSTLALTPSSVDMASIEAAGWRVTNGAGAL